MSIHLAKDLRSFFQEEVTLTASKQGLDLSPTASQYLASVLTKFTDARNLLQVEDNQKHSYPTLALMWLEGLHKSFSEQLFHMQHLGDVALFTSGFFGEKIQNSAVDMDYYIAMGGRAYETAGKIRESIAAERQLNIYFELASNFKECVELFSELSDKSMLGSDQGLLKLYQKWLESRAPRLNRMLNEAGVIAASGNSDPAKD